MNKLWTQDTWDRIDNELECDDYSDYRGYMIECFPLPGSREWCYIVDEDTATLFDELADALDYLDSLPVQSGTLITGTLISESE